MTQQMELPSSSNNELDNNDHEFLEVLSPYSQMRRQNEMMTQAFDVQSCSSSRGNVTSEMFADSPPPCTLDVTQLPVCFLIILINRIILIQWMIRALNQLIL